MDRIDEEFLGASRSSDADSLRTIYDGLRGLLMEEKYADLTIRCGGRDFKAHRAIVCTQSAFFDKACSGGFKESATGIVELPDDDPEILQCFLQYLYTGNYDDGGGSYFGSPAFAASLSLEEISSELEDAPGLVIGSMEDPEKHGYVGRLIPPPQSETGRFSYYIPDSNPIEDEGDDSHTATGFQQDSGPSGGPEPPDDAAYEPHEPSEVDEYSEGDAEKEDFVRIHTDDYGTDRPVDMFTSLRVYVMADKFDVPSLKLLARSRFYESVRQSYETSPDFPLVVDELYENTAENDWAIRQIPCRLIAFAFFEDLPVAKTLDAVLMKHGDLSLGVLKYTRFYNKGVWR